MSERTLRLAQRRNALCAHCAVQRSHLAATAQQIESRLGSIDRTVDMVRRFAGRPLLIVGGVALLAMIGPRRVIRWVGRSAVLLTTGQRVLRLIR